jgi:hypothetical protein
MDDICQFVKTSGETARVKFFALIWLMMEKIHYHPLNTKKSGKTTLDALHWFSRGLYHLTWKELNILYSLLRRTGTTKPTSVSAIEISTLLSRLCAINSEHFSGTSLSLNFKGVEPFISTLYSGDYPMISISQNDIRALLLSLGSTDSFT